MSSAGESCGTVTSKPISPEAVEKGYLWWPLGISWPQSKAKANLTTVTTKVDVMSGLVSLKLCATPPEEACLSGVALVYELSHYCVCVCVCFSTLLPLPL